MYKTISLFVILLIQLLLPFTGKSQDEGRKNYQLLWQISGNGLKEPSYLFATMHLRDPRVYDFSDSVLVALDRCKAFASEIDYDDYIAQAIADGDKRDTGNYLKKQLSNEEYEVVKNRLKEETGVDLENLKSKDPMVIRRLISEKYFETNNDRPTVLDEFLYRLAKQRGKPVFGLEDIDSQYRTFKGFNTDLEKEEFVGEFVHPDSSSRPGIGENKAIASFYKFQVEEIVNIYHSGDLNAIDKFRQRMGDDLHLNERNILMVERMDSLMKENALFSAVGAAHLPGEKGMIELLRKKGYILTPVHATFTGYCKIYEKQMQKNTGFYLERLSEGYTAMFPGTPRVMPIPNSNMKMFVYTDIQTGSVWMSAGIVSPDISSGSDEILKLILENMTKEGNGKLLKEKYIKYKGWPAVEALFTSEGYFQKVLLVKRNNRVFMMLSTAASRTFLESKNNTSFFSSLNMFELEDKSVKYSLLQDEKGKFSVLFPQQHNYLKKFEPIDEEGNEKYELYFYSAVDEERKVSYTIRFNDMPVGYYVGDDSTSIWEQIGYMKEFAQMTITDTSDFRLGEYEGLEITYKEKINSAGKIRIFLRGSRMYMLILQVADDSLLAVSSDSFFGSFRLLPLAEPKLTSLNKKDAGVYLRFPVLQKKEGIDSYQSIDAIDTSSVISGLDESTGLVTFLYEERFNPLFFRTNRDSLISFYKERYLSEKDSIVSEKTITDGSGVYFAVTKAGGNSYYKYHKICLCGQSQFLLIAMAPYELASSEAVARSFETFSCTKQPEHTFNLFEDKTNIILKNVSSSDSLTAVNAKKALDWIEADAENFENIYKVLTKPHSDDTIGYWCVKNKLLEKVKDFEKVNINLDFEEIFRSNKESTIKFKVLEVLASKGSAESIKSFFKLCSEFDPKEDEYYSYWSFAPFADKPWLIEENAGNFLQLQNRVYLDGFSSVLTQLLDLDTLDLNYLSNYQSSIEELLKNYLVKLKEAPDSSKYLYSDIVSCFARVTYSLYDAKKYVSVYKDMIEEEGMYIKAFAVVGLIKAGEEVDKKTVSMFFKEGYGLGSLLSETERSGKINELVNSISKEDLITGLIKLQFLYWDDYYPEKIALKKKSSADVTDFYSFRFAYDGGSLTNIGVIGFVKDDSGTIDFNNVYFDYFWEELSKKEAKEKEMEFYYNYQEWLKKEQEAKEKGEK